MSLSLLQVIKRPLKQDTSTGETLDETLRPVALTDQELESVTGANGGCGYSNYSYSYSYHSGYHHHGHYRSYGYHHGGYHHGGYHYHGGHHRY